MSTQETTASLREAVGPSPEGARRSSGAVNLRGRRQGAGLFAATAATLVLAGLVPSGILGTAHASKPSRQDRLDAKRSARDYWAGRGEFVSCSGVRLVWVPRWVVRRALGRGTLAAVAMGGCTIYYNQAAGWPWGKLCSVTVHEYGHLIGYRDSRNPNSIMYGFYRDANWWPRHPACG
jgi:Matrixin